MSILMNNNGGGGKMIIRASGGGGGGSWPSDSSHLTAGDGTSVTVGDGLSLIGGVLAASSSGAAVAAAETNDSVRWSDPNWGGPTGPTVTITVGASGLLILMFGCKMDEASSGMDCGFELSGANVVAPNQANATSGTNVGTLFRAVALSGLNPGVTTVTLRYSNFPYQWQTVSKRSLVAIAP